MKESQYGDIEQPQSQPNSNQQLGSFQQLHVVNETATTTRIEPIVDNMAVDQSGMQQLQHPLTPTPIRCLYMNAGQFMNKISELQQILEISKRKPLVIGITEILPKQPLQS